MQIKLEVENIEITQNQQHPNKMLWSGVLTRLGVPSDGAPCGTGGKLLIIDSAAAANALETIVNMPLNCEFTDDFWGSCPEYAMTGHDLSNVIGTITSGKVEGDALVCEGIIWKQNFPDVAFMINNAVDALGFSIELNVNASQESEDTITATDITFTGAATLWKKCAAYESTEFRQLVASRLKAKGIDNDMNEEQMKALLGEMLNGIKAELNSVKENMESVVSEVKAEVDKANSQVEQLALGLLETKEAIKAQQEPAAPTEKQEVTPVSAEVEPIVDPVAPVVEPPAPTVISAGQTVVPNKDISENNDDVKAKVLEINASNMNMVEKLKAISRLSNG